MKKFNNFIIPAEIMFNKSIGAYSKIVLSVILNFLNTKENFQTYSKISEICGFSIRQVNYCIKQLKSLGVISYTKTGRGHVFNICSPVSCPIVSVVDVQKSKIRFQKRDKIGFCFRLEIYQRDNFTCSYCNTRKDAKDLVIDHVVPVSRNGDNLKTNLITSCKKCNLAKGKKTEEEFRKLLKEKAEQIAEIKVTES